MGSDIHNLCAELGLAPASSPAALPEGNGDGDGGGMAGEPQAPPNLVQGLRSLLAAQPAQRQELAYLTATVGELGKVMTESVQVMKTEPKEASDSDKLGVLLAEHRQATAALLQSALEQQSQRNEVMVRHAIAGEVILLESHPVLMQFCRACKWNQAGHVRSFSPPSEPGLFSPAQDTSSMCSGRQ